MVQWSRSFPGQPEQVADARRFVLAVLAGHPEADAAALVASELCTNAVCHTLSGGPGGLFAVTVSRDQDGARVSVQDMGSRSEPVPGDANGEYAESGRGLLLVAAVAKEWGRDRNWLGWQVWAELSDGAGEPVW